MSEPVYIFRDGDVSRHSVTAQVAGEELDRLRSEKGDFFTPADVVDIARPQEAPLHPEFEWNNRTAAEEWRKWQARKLIQAIVVSYIETPKIPQSRAFVSVRTEDGPRFTDTVYAFEDPDLRMDVIAQARSAMEALMRKYGAFIDLAKTMDVFGDAAAKAEKRLYEEAEERV